MSTITEQKVDLLIEIANPAKKFISENLLISNDALKNLIADLKDDYLLKATLLQKLKAETIASLYKKGILEDNFLKDVFTKTNVSQTRLVDILRKIDFEQRKKLISLLEKENATLFADLSEKIDAKYGMLAGVLIQDISEKTKNVDIFVKLQQLFENDNCPLDIFLQMADSAARYRKKEYKEFVKGIIKLQKEILENVKKPIISREEFALVLKIAYLFFVSKDVEKIFENEIIIITNRLVLSVQFLGSGEAICIILEQLPEMVLQSVLHKVLKLTKVKDSSQRNKANLLKKLIEQELQKQKYSNISSCIKNNNLGYNINS